MEAGECILYVGYSAKALPPHPIATHTRTNEHTHTSPTLSQTHGALLLTGQQEPISRSRLGRREFSEPAREAPFLLPTMSLEWKCDLVLASEGEGGGERWGQDNQGIMGKKFLLGKKKKRQETEKTTSFIAFEHCQVKICHVRLLPGSANASSGTEPRFCLDCDRALPRTS